MKLKNLKICLLLPTIFDPDFPSRPAITEIYGHNLPSLGHKLIWITQSNSEYEYKGYEFFDSVKIYTTSLILSSNVIFKVFNLIKYYIKRFILINDILKKESYDIIQVRNDVFDAIITIILSKRYNIKFVFQYSFPKGAYKYMESSSFSPYAKLEEFLITFVLKRADLVLPISKWMEKDLINEGLLESKLYPLPMGVNTKLFTSNHLTNIRNKYKFKDSIVFIYVGSLSKIRRIDIIIMAFYEAVKLKNNLNLFLIGDGDDKKNLENLTVDLGIERNVIFAGKVSYYDVPKYINAADVGLSIIPPLPIYMISSPTKIFEYMALKKPIIANKEIYEQKEIIKISNSGLLVKFDIESIKNSFIKVSNDPQISVKGRSGYNWVKNNRTYEKMAKDMEEVYYDLIL